MILTKLFFVGILQIFSIFLVGKIRIFGKKIKKNLTKYKNPGSLILVRKDIINPIFKTLDAKFDYFKKCFTSVFNIQKPHFDPKDPDLI